MTKVPAWTTKIWSAVTRHRFPRFGDLSPKQSRVLGCVIAKRRRKRAVEENLGVPLALDGDKSPAESADKSAHSKACGCGASRVRAIGVDSWLNRRFLKLVILFSLLHFLLMVSVDGVIFLAAHVPPKSVNLDAPIRALQKVYEILRAPRLVLRWLWPGEHTPSLLNWLLTALNSLVWGLGLAGLKCIWSKARQ